VFIHGKPFLTYLTGAQSGLHFSTLKNLFVDKRTSLFVWGISDEENNGSIETWEYTF